MPPRSFVQALPRAGLLDLCTPLQPLPDMHMFMGACQSLSLSEFVTTNQMTFLRMSGELYEPHPTDPIHAHSAICTWHMHCHAA